jgi:solute carrier family 44 (choline transporter-like protein), member 1
VTKQLPINSLFLFFFLQIVIAIFSFVYGNPVRLINGYDSFGNTCGVKSNDKFANFPLSGLNTIDKPYLFFLDVKELRKTIKICVKQCPTKKIINRNELYQYYQDTNTQYCRYDFNMTLLLEPERSDAKYFDFLGPCPPLPVYEGKPVLHRCVPNGKDAPGSGVRDLYALINSWGLAQQLFSDIYRTWPTILALCALSLVFSVIMIALLHCLTKIISWVICVFVVVVSIALTGVLWWTYYDVKHNLDRKINVPLLEEAVKNESALFVLAIVSTIIMVLLILIVYFMKGKLAGLAALFEEAGKCMLSLPGLSGPPVLAFLALVVFLVFWTVVVICLATANYPGTKPLLPLGQIGESAKMSDSKDIAIVKNNTGKDYKSFMLVEFLEADFLRHMLWFYLVGLIWTCEFIFACQQLAIAGAVAYWYFKVSVILLKCHKIGHSLISYP